MPLQFIQTLKKLSLVLLLFLILSLCFISIMPVKGIRAQTPGQPTCDLCGWCNPTINPKPPNWDKCNACLNKTGQENYYTVFGCISSPPGKLPQTVVGSFLSLAFGIAGGIAFIMFLYGAVTVLTSSGNPEHLQDGKDLLTSSLIGLFLIIFSIFLLRAVGFDILQIPGFG